MVGGKKEVVIPVRKDTVGNAVKRQAARKAIEFIGRHKIGTVVVGLTLIGGGLDIIGTTWEPSGTVGDKNIEFALGDPKWISQDMKEQGIFYRRIKNFGAIAFDISTVASPATGGDIFVAPLAASPVPQT